MSETRRFRVTQVRSSIGSTQRQRQTLRALGLTGIGKTSVVRDSAAAQGRLRAVGHLVEVSEHNGPQ